MATTDKALDRASPDNSCIHGPLDVFEPEQLVHKQAAVRTTCAYCGVGCGVIARITRDDGVSRSLDIEGDPEHPANAGRLCVKGAALGETVHAEGRMAQPTVAGEVTSWDNAVCFIADQLHQTIQQYGADSVAFYVSGQLLTEDYYVINKFAKGFLGTANVDTNSRLCMSSAVAGHKRAFGSDTVPNCYADLELADLLIVTGSNLAWCHPVLFQRIEAAKQARPDLKVVLIDPRPTATLDIADLHLPIQPGQDVLLFNALLVELHQRGKLNHDYISQHVNGADDTLRSAYDDVSIGPVEQRLGLSQEAIKTFFDWFACTERSMTLFSMGVNQSSQGTDKVNAILNVHLVTGRIGKPGCGPFSLTGQPNAMGGREVGGLANMLAAHLEIADPQHRALVQHFWQSPRIINAAGLKAIDLFDAVDSGRIRFIWIMATNPVVSMPDADRVRAALAKCPTVVVSEVMADTDCTRLATVCLPAMGWSEKDGTVTNSERCISRQRAVLPAFGEARPDWWAVAAVARHMGFAGFNYAHPYDIFREHVALSAYDNSEHGIRRDFNLTALTHLSLDDYQTLKPYQWGAESPSTVADTAAHDTHTAVSRISRRFFAEGDFYTPDRRARLIPVRQQAAAHACTAEFPLVLNTGRIRDQWHTMTRTGLSSRLTQHISEPFLEINQSDAVRYGVAPMDIVEITSAWGSAYARATVSSDFPAGQVFMPIHWNGINSYHSRVGAVVNPATDPVSGQHEGKHTPVNLARMSVAQHGFLLTPVALPIDWASGYAVNVRLSSGFRQELAVSQSLNLAMIIEQLAPVLPTSAYQIDISHLVANRGALASTKASHIQHADMANRDLPDALQPICTLWLDGKQQLLAAAVLLPSSLTLPSRSIWDEMRGTHLTDNRPEALFCKLYGEYQDSGPQICSCFKVGRHTIQQAIEQGCRTVDQIGKACRAGTNCGSCQIELRKMLAESEQDTAEAQIRQAARQQRAINRYQEWHMRIVIVGHGMVGHRFLEVLAREIPAEARHAFEVTVVTEEDRPAYDRVQLSSYFSGKSADELSLVQHGFFENHGFQLRLNTGVSAIDRSARTVTLNSGEQLPYDKLVLATGSYPFVPPVPGRERPECLVYRTISDLNRMQAQASQGQVGVVIGGGLLGLEAAKALRDLELETHVVEFAPRLMAVQIDDNAGRLLRRKIEKLGVGVHTQKNTTEIVDGEQRRLRMNFADGTHLETDLIVFSAGIRPRDELGKQAGLTLGERGGIVVNDDCQTSDPDIYAIGEVALWSGRIYGLVAPGYQMAEVAARSIIEHEDRTAFGGADMSTKLKLLGVNVASIGDAHAATEGALTYSYSDEPNEIYKKIVVSGDGKRLLGAVLVGDTEDYGNLLQMMLNDVDLPEQPQWLILPDNSGQKPVLGADNLPDTAQICSCNNVSKGQICDAVADGNTDFEAIKSCTRAASSCGGCSGLVKQVINAELARMGIEVKKDLCEHFAYSRQELYHLCKVGTIKDFSVLLTQYGNGHADGCDICKPTAASIFASLWNAHVLNDRMGKLQDTNDYFLGNLQKDGTYSVIPRMTGGEVTPDGLIAVGQIAKKYGLYTKITGGQRVDMFGARKEQLPAIWHELIEAGFETGHAYGKSLRTVKSCVGSTWCRYGMLDSIGMAIRLENRYKGLRSPHKIKMAVSGCTRECAEAQSKDIGVIATENGWNLYVCGNGGMKPRHAELFATDLDDDTLIRYIDRLLMFYVQTADRLQRTSVWRESLEGGLDYLKQVVIADSLGMALELENQMQHIVDTYQDEWASAIQNPDILKRFRPFLNSDQPDPDIQFVQIRGQIRPATPDERRSSTADAVQ